MVSTEPMNPEAFVQPEQTQGDMNALRRAIRSARYQLRREVRHDRLWPEITDVPACHYAKEDE